LTISNGRAGCIVPRNAPFRLFEAESMAEKPELLVVELPENFFTQEIVEEKAAKYEQALRSAPPWNRQLRWLLLIPHGSERLDSPPGLI